MGGDKDLHFPEVVGRFMIATDHNGQNWGDSLAGVISERLETNSPARRETCEDDVEFALTCESLLTSCTCRVPTCNPSPGGFEWLESRRKQEEGQPCSGCVARGLQSGGKSRRARRDNILRWRSDLIVSFIAGSTIYRAHLHSTS